MRLLIKEWHVSPVISGALWNNVGRLATIAEKLIIVLTSCHVDIEFAKKMYVVLYRKDLIGNYQLSDLTKVNAKCERQNLNILKELDWID